MSAARRILGIPVLALVCLLWSAGMAQAQNGTITGLLVEDGTGTPLTGIPPVYVVTVYNANTGDTEGVSDNTDINGRYEITVPPGSYYVKVTHGTFHVPELHPNITCIAADCPLTAGTPVTVAAGGTTTVDFSLAKQGTIRGTVRRASNNSVISAIAVEIFNASTSLVKAVNTDSNGAYTVEGLVQGTYFARTTGPQAAAHGVIHELYGGIQCPSLLPDTDCRIASGTPITVAAGTTTSAVDFALDPGAGIAGAVVADTTSAAIAGLTVTAYLGEIAMGTAVTGITGLYTISGLPPGRYRVRTAVTTENLIDEWQNGVCVGCSGATTTITVTTGQAITGVNFSLAAGATIAGSVACNTAGLDQRGPDISLFDATGRLIRKQVTSSASFTPCRAGAPISYSFKGLPAGTYYVLAKDVPSQPGGTTLNSGLFVDQLYGGVTCVAADCDVRKGAPIVVTAGATVNGIDITLQPGGLLALAPDATVASYKLYDARGIELVDVIGLSAIGQQHRLIAGLPPGAYYLTKNGRLNGGSDCLDCPPTAGAPIIVGSGGVTGTTTFSTTSRSVKGTITNTVGNGPLSTIAVELVSGSGKVVGTALSNVVGSYTVTGLLPGTYFARTMNDQGFVDETYLDAACGTCDARTGTPIVVPSGTDVTGIDFVLGAGGVVSGLASDNSGIVLGNVPVSLFAGVTTFAGVKKTSPSGRYRLTLSAGTYRAVAEASTNAGSEVYSEMPCTSAGCDPATGTPITVTTGAITDAINFTLGSCTAMNVSPSLLATAVVNRAYRQVIGATGGAGPYVFDVTDGTLPLGLTLNSTTGRLEGTPTVAGQSTFRVSALDSTGCATDRSYVLDVQACAFTLSPVSATVAAAGGNVTITIANGCGSQDVTEAADWISVQSNTPGTVTLTIAANTESPRLTSVGIGRRTFEIRQAGAGSQAPFGALDLPLDGAQLSGAIAVGGWALDDLEVTRVRIHRDNVAGEPAGPIFIGNAVFIAGARPDVQQGYSTMPRSDRAGFGYVILTNMLPNQGNGAFRIHAVAEDAEGHTTLLGSRTIVVNNATAQQPFGTIDTPLPGETIAGSSYVNFGWALTPRPAAIAVDGSTIEVIVDGASIGTANYNFFRPDVSSAFPGLANSGGPVGHKIFDTTALAEGMHTIAWLVTDSRPALSGLGSRYFFVANSADAPLTGSGSVTTTETEVEATDVARPLGTAPAPDMGRRAESLSVAADATNASSANDVLITRGDGPARRLRVNDDGTGAVTLAPMERIELALGASDEACPSTWAGYLVKDGVLSDLPVGASLDPTGTFYWQTGPGFAGDFSLRFVRTNCRGEKLQIAVKVTIPLR